MVALKKYNLDGEAVGEVVVEDAFLDSEAHAQMIKDYLVALRANARQWSASTKGRSEVSHTTKKPYKQKGTGNARQGMLVAPQYKGGGIVFGPKPKFGQHVRINRKERRLATKHLLVEKIRAGALIVVEDALFNGAIEVPKTKSVYAFLKKLSLAGRRVLFVGEGESTQEEAFSLKHLVFKRSVRNVPKTEFTLAANVNGYDVAVAHKVVVTESALAELQEALK